VLEKDMSNRTWSNDPVNICGVTDCYQPAEIKYKLFNPDDELDSSPVQPTLFD
jgi:hypothetical protein